MTKHGFLIADGGEPRRFMLASKLALFASASSPDHLILRRRHS